MFQSLIKNIALGAVRHFLTGLGAAAVTYGYMSADDSNQAVGAAMLLVGFAWSGWQKYQTHKATGLTGATVVDTPVEVKPLPPVQ
jgi:hypothetical protein